MAFEFQVGFRYNALHVCAMKNQAEIAQLLLETLSNAGFYQLLYPKDSQEVTNQRLDHMVDLYLNMPDKGVSTCVIESFVYDFTQVDVTS